MVGSLSSFPQQTPLEEYQLIKQTPGGTKGFSLKAGAIAKYYVCVCALHALHVCVCVCKSWKVAKYEKNNNLVFIYSVISFIKLWDTFYHLLLCRSCHLPKAPQREGPPDSLHDPWPVHCL